MDTQNDGLEKVIPLQKWQCLVSMLDYVRFLGCTHVYVMN